MMLGAAHGVVIQPAPPLHSLKHSKRRLDGGRPHQHSTPRKRFSVRDGFHLHDRNQELKESIDRRLFPPTVTEPPTEPHEAAERGDATTSSSGVSGPNATQIPLSSHHSRSVDSHNEVKDADGCSSGVEARATNVTERIERIASILDRILVVEDKPHHPTRVPSHHSTRDSGSAIIDAIAQSNEAPMLPSAEWLIYRHRPNAASHWQQVKMEKLLRDTLQKEEQQRHDALESVIGTPTCISPPRPRHQSTLGSTYAERVAAARQQRQQDSGSSQSHRPDLSARGIVGASITEKERHLVHSREADNKDVDRLLLSLFQPPISQPAAGGGSAVATPPALTPSSSRFSTRRSELREQTAAALKSRKLRSRVDELRSLPDLIAKIESMQRLKHQQLVQDHGEDLVLKNRYQVRLSVLQRSAETPVFPSAIDQKLQLATKRKKELDQAQETAVRDAVSRWQKRRRQQQELQAQRFRESQWLLIVMLAQSSVKWIRAFHLFKKKRDALSKVLMAKRIQRYWRQATLVRQNSLALLSFAPQTPITSPFYRIPVVMKAIRLVQRCIRRWLESKRRFARRKAVAIIVTSWFEFQDVKFRRLILRFRKRVRDFQIMWREWRAITDARVKLLLLVWSKLEKKLKRRHGLFAPLRDAAQLAPSSPRQPAQEEPRAMTLVEYFRLANASNGVGGGQNATTREQKRLEGVHRHLRNRGTVQAPIDVVAAVGSGNASVAVGTGTALSPTPAAVASATATSQPASPSKPQAPPPAAKVVKRNLKLVQNMGEELQLAMYDYYTTAKTPKASNKTSNPPTASSPTAKKAPVDREEGRRSPPQQHNAASPFKQQAQSPSSMRGKQKAASSPAKQAPLVALLASVGGGPRQNEKVSMQLKMTLLRQLLSGKRRHFRETREKKREEWTADRQHKRRVEFRYNVLDELAAFQRFQAENKLFLLLHSVSEADMVRLIHHAQQLANDAANPLPPTAKAQPGTPSRRSSLQAPFRGRRSSSIASIGRPASGLSGPDASTIAASSKSHSIIAVGGARLERFDDDEEQART